MVERAMAVSSLQTPHEANYRIAWSTSQLERTNEGKIPKLVDELIGFVACVGDCLVGFIQLRMGNALCGQKGWT
jgi:hypothetical protein